MKKKITAAFLCSVLLLSGCTKSNIVAPDDSAPNMMVMEGIEIQWDDVETYVNESYTGEGEYEFAKQVAVEADENGDVTITAIVDSAADGETAVQYADVLIKAVNDEAATQDFSYSASEEESFGGYFEKHNVSISIVPEGKEEDQAAWLVNTSIGPESTERSNSNKIS